MQESLSQLTQGHRASKYVELSMNPSHVAPTVLEFQITSLDRMLSLCGVSWTPEAHYLLTKCLTFRPSPDCARGSAWATLILPFHFSKYKPHGALQLGKTFLHSLPER